jgi:hypothetical protein
MIVLQKTGKILTTIGIGGFVFFLILTILFEIGILLMVFLDWMEIAKPILINPIYGLIGLLVSANLGIASTSLIQLSLIKIKEKPWVKNLRFLMGFTIIWIGLIGLIIVALIDLGHPKFNQIKFGIIGSYILLILGLLVKGDPHLEEVPE